MTEATLLHICATVSLSLYILSASLSLSKVLSPALRASFSLRFLRYGAAGSLLATCVLSCIASPVDSGLYYLLVALFLESFIITQIIEHPLIQLLLSACIVFLLVGAFYLIHVTSATEAYEAGTSVFLYVHVVLIACAEASLISAGLIGILFFWLRRQIQSKKLLLILGSQINLPECAATAHLLASLSCGLFLGAFLFSGRSLIPLLLAQDLHAWLAVFLFFALFSMVLATRLFDDHAFFTQSRRMVLTIALSVLSLLMVFLRVTRSGEPTHPSIHMGA
jgi:hypothetical protein